MKQTVIYSFIGLALLLNGCQKNKLPKLEEPETPVFYVKCDINNIPVSLQAGLDDYIMNSSYYKDENNLYVYKSELRKDNCLNGCGYEVTILINNSAFSSDTSTKMNPDESLASGTYLFGNGSSAPLSYKGTFYPLNPASDASYTWTFDDGVILSGPSVTRNLVSDRKYTLAMNVNNSATGCSIDHTNEFKTGKHLQTTIYAEKLTDKKYKFRAIEGNKPPYKYTWRFSPSVSTNDPSPEYTFNSPGYYTTTLTLVGADGDSCISKYMIPPPGQCEANYVSKIEPVQNNSALSAITLLVKDQKGQVFSSANSPQLSGSKFQILSAEEYDVNGNNERTRKIKISFSCTIRDGANTLTVTNGEAVIAVAYK